VGERRAAGRATVNRLRNMGQQVVPVEVSGRSIAKTFWGKAWCKNLESYSDYSNRLPRGRSYVRHGTVVDLKVHSGEVTGLVSGSSLYSVRLSIAPLSPQRWEAIREACAGEIGSLVDLLMGKLSRQVMAVVTEQRVGLFPSPSEITLACSCPDWATMCKHVAAVMYGVGARLDDHPELLFTLRGVEPSELLAEAVTRQVSTPAQALGQVLDSEDLGDMFGIDLEDEDEFDLPASPPAPQESEPSSVPCADEEDEPEVHPRDLGAIGLSPATLQLLILIINEPGLGADTLGRVLSLTPAQVAQGIDVLEERELVHLAATAGGVGYQRLGRR